MNAQLRALWLREGGAVDNIREFHALALRSGIVAKFPDITRFLRELSLPDEVRERLDELWEERQSSVAEFYDRAKRAEIPVTYAQVEKYVKESAERTTERFLAPKRAGRSFAYEPSSEWKADVVYMIDSDERKYMLIRINSWSREVDATSMSANDSEQVAPALRKLLERASVQPKILLTDQGREFLGDVTELLAEKGIQHVTKEPRDYGAFAILDSGISKLRRLIRTENVDKAE